MRSRLVPAVPVLDSLYAALGVLGVTPVLKSYPHVLTDLCREWDQRLIYGFLTARSQPVAPAHPDAPHVVRETAHEMWSGFKVGLALIVLNPAAVATWVVIMAFGVLEANTSEGVVCAIGVFIGSLLVLACRVPDPEGQARTREKAA